MMLFLGQVLQGQSICQLPLGQELPVALQQGGPHLYSHQLIREELGKGSEVSWSSALFLFPLYALPRVTPPPLPPSLVKGQGASPPHHTCTATFYDSPTLLPIPLRYYSESPPRPALPPGFQKSHLLVYENLLE